MTACYRKTGLLRLSEFFSRRPEQIRLLTMIGGWPWPISVPSMADLPSSLGSKTAVSELTLPYEPG